MKPFLLLPYYQKTNGQSFNALLGALEILPCIELWDIKLASEPTELLSLLAIEHDNYEKIVVAISYRTAQLPDIESLVINLQSWRKKENSHVILIAGGPHPTGCPQHPLELGCDIVVVGEGEETFNEILERISLHKNYTDVQGIALLDQDIQEHNRITHSNSISIKINPQRSPCNLDIYPPFPLRLSALGPLEITRGCPHVCGFCQTPFLFGTQIRHRSIQTICQIIERLSKKGLRDLRFISPNLLAYGSSDGKTANIPTLYLLFSSLRKILGPQCRMFLGSFPSEVRPEFITLETVAILKEFASNDNITLGAQSGSTAILQQCHRGHTVEQIYNAVKITQEAGFTTNVDFIFGLPGETHQDVQATMKLIRELVALGAKIHAHSFMPLPQTRFANCKSAPEILNEYFHAVQYMIGQGKIFGAWQSQNRLSQHQQMQ